MALEEHFRDDDEGPLSNHGYMPYLNTFLLDKVGLKSSGKNAPAVKFFLAATDV